MLQNETQQKAHLEIEMKLLQSLAEMRPFSSSPHTKGENHELNCQWAHPATQSAQAGAITRVYVTNKRREANTHLPVCVFESHSLCETARASRLGKQDETPAGSTRGSGGFQFQIRQIRVCSVWKLFLLEWCCVTASTQSKFGVSN